jgi:hypothetical protein
VPFNLPYNGKNTRYEWFDQLREGNHGMKPGEVALLHEIVRMSSENWQEYAYQSTALRNHDLAHRGVFTAWPSIDTLAHRIGVQRRQLQTLSKRLQDRGYLTVLPNAGGTDKWTSGTRPNLWAIDARTVPAVQRGALQYRQGCTPVPTGVHSSTDRGALQCTQIVIEESVNTNSLNVAEYGQREIKSVKPIKQPEQMSLLEAVRDACPHGQHADQMDTARALAKMGATPDEVRQFTAWWIGSGHTYKVTPATIERNWTAFAAAHSTDSHKPTASTAPRPACATQDCVDGWIPRLDSATSDPCPTCRPNWPTKATKPEPAITAPAASPAGLEGVRNALRQATTAQEAAIV